VGLPAASDPEIFDYAAAQAVVVVTADTDIGMLLALRRSVTPSVILLRSVAELSPDDHAALLVANISTVAEDLEQGASVSLSPDRLRVRHLPMQ
jgi:predicted nuclease of predicted toxin-antitoxin system